MSDPLIDTDEASTPTTPDERADLIPSHITNRDELNEFEARGVAGADRWAFSRRRSDLLSSEFLCQLHKRMFGEVWKWAGTYSREVNRRIGVDCYQIEPQLRELFDTVRYWIDHKSYSPDEIAVRFHHRLTQIHPFPNGNGRLARLAAELLIVELGGERFTWSRANLVEEAEARKAYMDALHQADVHVIEPLIGFARSSAQ
jgi:Fic-DOC domain mobile mystery protein B